MNHQQVDDWQHPLWNPSEVDPSYFMEFLATDTTQDATFASIGLDTLTSDIDHENLRFGIGSGPSGTIDSEIHTADAVSNQSVESCSRPPVQRQRTLPRRRSKYMIRRSVGTFSPIAIPISRSHYEYEQEQSLAMQRWRNSPPEDEAASLTAICNALGGQSIHVSSRASQPCSRDAFHKHRGPSSTTSLDSAASGSSLRSGNSSHSATSQKRRTQASRTRAKGKAKIKNTNDPDWIFKCTFCCDTFKTKYDWARHEKSLHLNMEEWACTPHGASVVLPLTGRVHCAYCSALDPTPIHLQEHNHMACDGQSTPRIFRRKDHLVQHLRLVHGLNTLPLIDDWKLESAPITSRCGICDTTLYTWDERADHLTAHFRAGRTMEDWKGEHGFEPAIAARVLNAFPPYLVADQAKTVVPFSATNPGSIDHTKQFISHLQLEDAASAPTPEDTLAQGCQDMDDSLAALRTLPFQQNYDFAKALTQHLSRFARQQMLSGIIPTDEMFQRESRRLFYQDEEDGWNQTLADNPSWLHDFRQQSGFF